MHLGGATRADLEPPSFQDEELHAHYPGAHEDGLDLRSVSCNIVGILV